MELSKDKLSKQVVGVLTDDYVKMDLTNVRRIESTKNYMMKGYVVTYLVKLASIVENGNLRSDIRERNGKIIRAFLEPVMQIFRDFKADYIDAQNTEVYATFFYKSQMNEDEYIQRVWEALTTVNSFAKFVLGPIVYGWYQENVVAKMAVCGREELITTFSGKMVKSSHNFIYTGLSIDILKRMMHSLMSSKTVVANTIINEDVINRSSRFLEEAGIKRTWFKKIALEQSNDNFFECNLWNENWNAQFED